MKNTNDTPDFWEVVSHLLTSGPVHYLPMGEGSTTACGMTVSPLGNRNAYTFREFEATCPKCAKKMRDVR